MHDLNDLYYFVKVVEHGSYAAASRALLVPKSRLSRRIIALEERLGIRLIQRSTRRLAITDIGQEYYRHCVAMLVEAEAAQEVIDRSRSGPQGLIRVSAPPALLCFEAGPMIARYMAANPLVTVELESTSRRVDVIGESIDIALRVRFPPVENSDLTLRVLGDSKQRMVASPGLINQGPATLKPADLALLPSLDLNQTGGEHAWKLDGPNQSQVRIRHSPRLVTDDMSQLLHAAVEGVGVVQLPAMVAEDALQAGTIVDLLPNWRPVAGSVQAIFPSRRGLLPSVRSLIDFLVMEYARRDAADNG
ncbi:LysR substrate-binding domain-containing protein [Granulosicoccus antarcticus]|uniref:HTH-type transcriptional regulator DmlR n=1 Tax=Granulosicoccus antarcticus IMCC3135 TaxID=1192854 RepID=A0A2Z2P1G8_9GAMM|nr:LysR substrate-binding domain-containing protein [Granulosicoccus antarcticus]ASJ76038.1 HTH-type transcriptional regulator DmlR [Granulosicoccus antarcticus IMCC3135]